jgi:hypothetical protein
MKIGHEVTQVCKKNDIYATLINFALHTPIFHLPKSTLNSAIASTNLHEDEPIQLRTITQTQEDKIRKL